MFARSMSKIGLDFETLTKAETRANQESIDDEFLQKRSLILVLLNRQTI